jgi:hypothetical protein
MLIDVQIRQPHIDCPIYTWEREHECMRLTGIYRAEPGLPADLATLQLEGRLNVPILLLTTCSSPPGTLVQARLLGALSVGYLSPRQDAQFIASDGGRFIAAPREGAFPADDWVFVAVAEADASLSQYQSIDMPGQGGSKLTSILASLKAYVQAKAQEELQQTAGEVQWCDADMAARLIRETRLFLKREQRMQPKGKGWLRREEEEERPVAWRAIEGLAEALRVQIQKEAFLQDGTLAPHAQAEELIRFVPQRFQHALADLLLDDERLLVFVERPLLRHRTGWLGMQTWRSNEGLFLVTDRQMLWLRDFLAPGSNFLPGGYIAHMAPLEHCHPPSGHCPR